MDIFRKVSKFISNTEKSSETLQSSKNPKSPDTSPTFLVVDDDDLFRRIIEKAGRKVGFHILTCASLKDAFKIKEKYDVVILDYLLGAHERGTDGLAFFENTPVVLISSVGNKSGIQPDVPSLVKKFLPKEVGVKTILMEALKYI